MRPLCLSLLLLVPTVAAAAPPAVTPVPKSEPSKWSEVKADAGRLLVLSAEPASKWLAVDDTDFDLHVFELGKLAAFTAPTVGRYRVIVTGPDGTATRLVVVVGDQPPPPKPPEPVDELRQRLKTAYDADGGDDKAEAAKDLAELYKQASRLSADPTVATAGDLLKRAKDAANVLIGPDALRGPREVVKGELQRLFPADGTLTEQQRTAAAALFTKLAAIFDTFN
jgi:hypothetical protein